MSKYFIDRYIIHHWAQGYTLEVGSIRPQNAPKFRHTNEDSKRLAYIAKINLELARQERYFESMKEIEDYIAKLNGVSDES